MFESFPGGGVSDGSLLQEAWGQRVGRFKAALRIWESQTQSAAVKAVQTVVSLPQLDGV